jgi:hypothetical protein
MIGSGRGVFIGSIQNTCDVTEEKTKNFSKVCLCPTEGF